MFDKNKTHLVPPILIDWAASLMNPNNSNEFTETQALKLETARDFCISVLESYNRSKKTRHR